MYLDLRLPDGRAVGPPDFSVFNHLPLSADRRRAIATAWPYRGQSEGISIVLAKNKRLIAAVYGHTEWGLAIDAVVADLKRTYRFYGRKFLPERGVVALIKPFPALWLRTLSFHGVDTIFSLERLSPDREGREQEWIDAWLGTHPSVNKAYPRIFMLPHWKRGV